MANPYSLYSRSDFEKHAVKPLLTPSEAAAVLVEKYAARVRWDEKDQEWFFAVPYSYESTGPDLGEALLCLDLQDVGVQYSCTNS